jgi:hypothetical protein
MTYLVFVFWGSILLASSLAFLIYILNSQGARQQQGTAGTHPLDTLDRINANVLKTVALLTDIRDILQVRNMKRDILRSWFNV